MFFEFIKIVTMLYQKVNYFALKSVAPRIGMGSQEARKPFRIKDKICPRICMINARFIYKAEAAG